MPEATEDIKQEYKILNDLETDLAVITLNDDKLPPQQKNCLRDARRLVQGLLAEIKPHGALAGAIREVRFTENVRMRTALKLAIATLQVDGEQDELVYNEMCEAACVTEVSEEEIEAERKLLPRSEFYRPQFKTYAGFMAAQTDDGRPMVISNAFESLEAGVKWARGEEARYKAKTWMVFNVLDRTDCASGLGS